ncbi:PAS domain-containing protein [Methanoculleus sp.]|nr:PAS domain-containing protein [Methanoculleus sp.]
MERAPCRGSMLVVAWSPEMSIRAVNTAFALMTGRRKDCTESMSLRDIESLDRTAGKIADVVRSRRTVVEKVTLDLPQGARTMTRLSAPIMDENGNVVEILTVYQDVIP